MSHGPARLVLVLLALGIWQDGRTIDRIVFQADEVTTAAGTGAGVEAVLDLSGPQPKLELTSTEFRVAGLAHAFSAIQLHCEQLVVHEPEFACLRGKLRALDSPIGPLSMQAHAAYNSAARVIDAGGNGLTLAGGVLRFDVRTDARGWTANSHADALSLAGIRQVAVPWLSFPKDFTFDGRLDGDLQYSGSGVARTAALAARISGLALTNKDGTVVTQALDAQLDLKTNQDTHDSKFDMQLTSAGGQALAGPLLLDLKANPIEFASTGEFRGRTAVVEHFALHQKDLIDAEGASAVSFADHPSIDAAHVDVHALSFPAAYASFMQIPLATTDFAALKVSGTATGSIDVAKNALDAFNLAADKIQIADDKAKFSFDDVRASIHWAAQDATPVEPSMVAWTRGSAYGISGGAAQINFRVQSRHGELLAPARLPVFDGAVLVNTFSISKPGDSQMELAFDAQIEPISMAKLSRAFGWPEFSGEVSGRIPALTYHNHELALGGDLEAKVFDGTIIGKNLRLQDPLGPWPRLFADITARNLNLDLITHTFPIGSITGRVDADMHGLELFNWAPVAFDARIFTTAGDRSSHRISQRAISSISSLGGGGGGVAAALQSGFLRFFDTFRYDRLGLSCQLRNDVCLMSGIEPTKTGYYIVKGGGLPRINIIGNAGRVDWSTLLAQIESGMHSENVIVR